MKQAQLNHNSSMIQTATTSARATAWLRPWLAYLDSDFQLWQYHRSAQKWQAKHSSLLQLPWIVVLNRRHYFETQHKFPIVHLPDLRAAITFQADNLNPYGKNAPLLYLINQQDEQHSLVNIWLLKPDCLDHIKQGLLVLPESLLLALGQLTSAEQSLFAINQGSSPYLLYYQAKRGLVSQWCDKKDRNNENDESSQQFCAMAGFTAKQTPQVVLDHPLNSDIIFRGIKRLTLRQWRGFLFLSNQHLSLRKLPWRNMALVLLSGLILYMGGLNYYLYHSEQQLSQTIQQKRHELSKVLQLQSQYKTLSKRYSALSAPLGQHIGTWRFWQILQQTKSPGTQYQQVRLNGSAAEIQGLTPSATDLLERIAKHAAVIEPHFYAPMRKTDKGQQFSIRFELLRTEGSHE